LQFETEQLFLTCLFCVWS